MENHSSDRIRLHELEFVPFISAAEVQARVVALGEALDAQFAGKNPLFIGVLSGAFIFTADLVRGFRDSCEIAFVKLSSYAGVRSSGQVQSVIGLDKDLRGRHLIVVEDIVDTGRTLHFFLETLYGQQPASLTVVALLRKPAAAEFPVPLDLVGFDIENRFVVGYGLDYEGLGRNLPGIYVLFPGVN